MSTEITYERRYPHPPEKVWRALTDSSLVSRWLMPTDIEAREGHAFTFQAKARPGFDGRVHCVVRRAEPYEILSYTWSGGGLTDTLVTYRLQPDGSGGTRLHFTHGGFEGLLNRLIVRNLLASGWRGKLLNRQLPTLLDQL